MIRVCEKCQWTYDDEFRLTFCPHRAFWANDGKNNFALHEDAVLIPPTQKEEQI